MDRAERLKLARTKRGLETALAAAQRLGVPYGTYSGHENGSRGIKDEDLKRYAEFFRVPLGWLAFGEVSPKVKVACLSLGSASQPMSSDARRISLDIQVPFYVPDDVEAIRIDTVDYEPNYLKGDVLFIRATEALPYGFEGKRVFVTMAAAPGFLLGTVLRVRKAEAGYVFDIHGADGRISLDVEPEKVAPVIGLVPG